MPSLADPPMTSCPAAHRLLGSGGAAGYGLEIWKFKEQGSLGLCPRPALWGNFVPWALGSSPVKFGPEQGRLAGYPRGSRCAERAGHLVLGLSLRHQALVALGHATFVMSP